MMIPTLRVKVELEDLMTEDFTIDEYEIRALIRRTVEKDVRRAVHDGVADYVAELRGKIRGYLEPRMDAIFQAAVDRLDVVSDDALIDLSFALDQPVPKES
jgi:hypothetical protein